MAISRDTITYNLDDSRIFPLLTDPVGGSPTYGNGVDVAGIQGHTATLEFITAELSGDAKRLDVYSKVDKVTGSVRHAMIGMDTLAALMGGTVAETGVTPNQKVAWSLAGAMLPGYYKLESQVKYLGGADVGGGADFHMILPKVRITGFSVEFSGDSYAQVSFDYSAIPLQSSDELIRFEKNETAVPIATTSDTTPPTVSSSLPADGASNVVVGSTIAFTFSESMMLSSMEPATFFLSTAAGVAVAFGLAYDVSSKVATLTPTSDLSAGTVYLAGVTTGARDLAGNRLAAQHVINFTTA